MCSPPAGVPLAYGRWRVGDLVSLAAPRQRAREAPVHARRHQAARSSKSRALIEAMRPNGVVGRHDDQSMRAELARAATASIRSQPISAPSGAHDDLDMIVLDDVGQRSHMAIRIKRDSA